MLQSIDHVVIVVRDLAQATAEYTQTGFTVIPGGEHADGLTHNALIAFGDGAYIELIAFKQATLPATHQWQRWHARGEGLVDFALRADDLSSAARHWREQGLHVVGPHDGGRRRPDGQQLAWRIVTFAEATAATPLPFVIEDVTPRALRVPDGDAAQHHLPVRRVAGVTIAVGNLAARGHEFATLLGIGGTQGIAANMLRFDLGQQWIMLAGAGNESSDMGRYVRHYGDGIYEVTLAGGNSTTLAAHGARIRIENSKQPKGM